MYKHTRTRAHTHTHTHKHTHTNRPVVGGKVGADEGGVEDFWMESPHLAAHKLGFS